jgi:hypothetical protein
MLGERFYFGLAGSKTLEDTLGLPFPSELAAFRSAQTLAKEIAETRPLLRGTTLRGCHAQELCRRILREH